MRIRTALLCGMAIAAAAPAMAQDVLMRRPLSSSVNTTSTPTPSTAPTPTPTPAPGSTTTPTPTPGGTGQGQDIGQWQIGDWSDWSSGRCDPQGTRTRSVVCLGTNDEPIDDSLCPQPKPETVQTGDDRDCYSYYWQLGTPSYPECSPGATVHVSYPDRKCMASSDDGTSFPSDPSNCTPADPGSDTQCSPLRTIAQPAGCGYDPPAHMAAYKSPDPSYIEFGNGGTPGVAMPSTPSSPGYPNAEAGAEANAADTCAQGAAKGLTCCRIDHYIQGSYGTFNTPFEWAEVVAYAPSSTAPQDSCEGSLQSANDQQVQAVMAKYGPYGAIFAANLTPMSISSCRYLGQ